MSKKEELVIQVDKEIEENITNYRVEALGKEDREKQIYEVSRVLLGYPFIQEIVKGYWSNIGKGGIRGIESSEEAWEVAKEFIASLSIDLVDNVKSMIQIDASARATERVREEYQEKENSESIREVRESRRVVLKRGDMELGGENE